MSRSPIFEFGPNLTENPFHYHENNSVQQDLSSLLQDDLNRVPSTFDTHNHLSVSSILGPNAVVYRVPDNVPLTTILAQLGVDLNTLRRSSSDSNHYRGYGYPIEYPSERSFRRPKLVCYDVSNSDDDIIEYRRTKSVPRFLNQYQHSSTPQSMPNNAHPPLNSQPSTRIHNLLQNAWNRMSPITNNPDASGSAQNLNSQWQRSRESTSPTPMMLNSNSYSSSSQMQAMQNVWNRASNPMNVSNRMGQQASPPNQAAVNNFRAVRNLPYENNQVNQSVGNVWNRASNPMNVSNRMGQQASPPNQTAVNNFRAVRNLPYENNQVNQSVGNVWNRADAAVRNSPSPTFNATTNNIFTGGSTNYTTNRANPQTSNVWNRANNAVATNAPIQSYNSPMGFNVQGQPHVPYGFDQSNTTYRTNSTVPNVWNRMSNEAKNMTLPPYGSPTSNTIPQGMSSSYNPYGNSVANNWNMINRPSAPQNSTPYPSSILTSPPTSSGLTPAPSSFSALLSQANRQRSNYPLGI